MSGADGGRTHAKVDRIAGPALGVRQESHAIAHLSEGCDIGACHVADAHSIDGIGSDRVAKGKPGKDHQLVHGVPPVHIE
jgi:hypothetical protein